MRGAYPPYFINLHRFVGVDKRTVYTKCGGVCRVDKRSAPTLYEAHSIFGECPMPVPPHKGFKIPCDLLLLLQFEHLLRRNGGVALRVVGHFMKGGDRHQRTEEAGFALEDIEIGERA